MPTVSPVKAVQAAKAKGLIRRTVSDGATPTARKTSKRTSKRRGSRGAPSKRGSARNKQRSSDAGIAVATTGFQATAASLDQVKRAPLQRSPLNLQAKPRRRRGSSLDEDAAAPGPAPQRGSSSMALLSKAGWNSPVNSDSAAAASPSGRSLLRSRSGSTPLGLGLIGRSSSNELITSGVGVGGGGRGSVANLPTAWGSQSGSTSSLAMLDASTSSGIGSNPSGGGGGGGSGGGSRRPGFAESRAGSDTSIRRPGRLRTTLSTGSIGSDGDPWSRPILDTPGRLFTRTPIADLGAREGDAADARPRGPWRTLSGSDIRAGNTTPGTSFDPFTNTIMSPIKGSSGAGGRLSPSDFLRARSSPVQRPPGGGSPQLAGGGSSSSPSPSPSGSGGSAGDGGGMASSSSADGGGSGSGGGGGSGGHSIRAAGALLKRRVLPPLAKVPRRHTRQSTTPPGGSNQEGSSSHS